MPLTNWEHVTADSVWLTRILTNEPEPSPTHFIRIIHTSIYSNYIKNALMYNIHPGSLLSRPNIPKVFFEDPCGTIKRTKPFFGRTSILFCSCGCGPKIVKRFGRVTNSSTKLGSFDVRSILHLHCLETKRVLSIFCLAGRPGLLLSACYPQTLSRYSTHPMFYT